MKKLGKALLFILLAVVLVVVGVFGYLTVAEFRPDDVEPVALSGSSQKLLRTGELLDVLSWNVGYGALGEGSDFFMDGGESVMAADRPTVEKYLAGIREYIYTDAPDLVILQEVDANSKRSYGIDERAVLSGDALPVSAYAMNYSVDFVPYPVPPLGKVHSGLYTLSSRAVDSAERISLPCPFKWPVRVANLKRCLLVTRLPIEGTDAQLVLVNFHLEAYDSGEGKIAQTKQLFSFLEEESKKGNYVIAGGDCNQSLPGGLEAFPVTDYSLWVPGNFDYTTLPEGFRFISDSRTASCRSLDKVYDPGNTQLYLIDGFLVSANVDVEDVETVDLGFENSDHNPVRLLVTLR